MVLPQTETIPISTMQSLKSYIFVFVIKHSILKQDTVQKTTKTIDGGYVLH